MHSKPQAEHMRIKPQFREELTPILNLSPPPPKKKKKYPHRGRNTPKLIL